MIPRRSFGLFILAMLQTLFWIPYLFNVPWTLPEATMIGRHWLLSDFHFDLGTATDFVPAVAMVLAGTCAMNVGLRRDLSRSAILWAICADAVALFVLTGMIAVGILTGVAQWTGSGWWLVLTLLLWFAPPILSIALMKRRTKLLEHAT
jgi:hypothetical protein